MNLNNIKLITGYIPALGTCDLASHYETEPFHWLPFFLLINSESQSCKRSKILKLIVCT